MTFTESKKQTGKLKFFFAIIKEFLLYLSVNTTLGFLLFFFLIKGQIFLHSFVDKVRNACGRNDFEEVGEDSSVKTS